MSAQQEWKIGYRLYFDGDLDTGSYMMGRYKREAALERQIAAQQRRIVELQDRVWQLESHVMNYDDGVRFSDETPLGMTIDWPEIE